MPPSNGMQQWEKDKQKALVFLPEAKTILAEHLWAEAPASVDQNEATDLITIVVEPTAVAFRVRDVKYLQKYRWDVTFREDRPSGAKCEFEKIRDGFAKFYLYCFGDYETERLVAWRLLDLDLFRAQWQLNEPPLRYERGIPNRDGSSSFVAFDTRTFDQRVTVAKWCATRPLKASAMSEWP